MERQRDAYTDRERWRDTQTEKDGEIHRQRKMGYFQGKEVST